MLRDRDAVQPEGQGCLTCCD